MTVSVKWFEDWDQLAADAGGALDRAKQPRLFDRFDWYRLTRDHIDPIGKPHVLRARTGDRSAWLFLSENGPRCAQSLTSWYSLGGGPIFAGHAADILLAALLREAGRRFDKLTMLPLDAGQTAALSSLLRQTGWRPFSDRISTNWSIDIGGRDFASYWSDRPARLRNTVMRRERSHPLRITIHRQFDPTAWQAYEAIYAASWKNAEGSPDFLRALAEQEAANGALRLGIAEDPQGCPVAAQFWLTENGIATIHKLAHREDAKAGSPGSILSRAMFENAIDRDHVSRIDFGLGDESYKAEWMDTVKPIYRIDGYRPVSRRGAIGIAREIASRLARRRTLR